MDGKAATTITTTSDNHDDDVSKININKVLYHLPTSAKYVLLKDILGSEDYNGKMMIIIIIIIFILCIKDGDHGLYTRFNLIIIIIIYHHNHYIHVHRNDNEK